MTKPLTMRFVVSVFAVVVTLAAATISASSSDPPSSSRTSSPVGNALDANAGKETAVERNKSGVDSKGEERGILDYITRSVGSFAGKFRSGGGVKPFSSIALRAGTKNPTSRRNSFRRLLKTYMGMGGAAAKGAARGKSVGGFKKWVISLLRRFRTKKKSAEDGNGVIVKHEGAVGKAAADKTPDLLPRNELVAINKSPNSPGGTTTVDGKKKKSVTWNDAQLTKVFKYPGNVKAIKKTDS